MASWNITALDWPFWHVSLSETCQRWPQPLHPAPHPLPCDLSGGSCQTLALQWKTSPDRASSSPGFLITQFILLSFHFILIFLQLEILTLVTVGWMFDILTNDTQNWVFATD